MVEVYTRCHLITGVREEAGWITVGHGWSNMEKAVPGEPGCVHSAFIILNDPFITSDFFFFFAWTECL